MRPIAHNHPFRVAWNILILCAILAFLFIITYRVVFGIFAGGLFYSFLNALFVADIALNFVTKVKLGHVRVEEPREIARRYLRGWFVVDAVSAIPFELILVAAFGGSMPEGHWAQAAYRLLQLLTLLKLLKVGRIFKELQEALDIIPALRRLILFGYWVAAWLHAMVLGWIMIGGTEQAREPVDQYIRALYWIITTIATIGYGDYTPDHESNVQLIYAMGVEIFGVGMFSYVIANVSNLVSNLDLARRAWQERLDEINSFMRSQRIPAEMQGRVRDYFSYLWSQQKGVNARDALSDVPNGLSQEILMFLNRDVLAKVGIFKGADELFLRESVRLMRPQVFLPGEHIIRQGEFADCMYFLASGDVRIVVDGNEVARLGPGSPFGETALINNQFRNASVISDSYGTGYRLDKNDFNVLRSKYPEFDRRVEAIARSREG